MSAVGELASVAPSATAADPIDALLLQREIEATLYRESELLDERRFEEWLDLLTEDMRYRMPLMRNVRFGQWDREQTRDAPDTAWFDEDKATLHKRVRQLMTGLHWAEEPVSRVSHLVTNVQIVSAMPSIRLAQEVSIKSRFLVCRNRMETETDLFVGKREDTLRKVDGAWKIASRRIILDQTVLLAKNLTVFF